jgi:hypothetical protein|tara:strand:- start:219 stop:428 length:210 start_codon:yes stop_codon:yes gene_type:complete
MKIRGYNNKSRVRQRQEEAIERQKVYDGRTPEQQLKLVKSRPGESKKEKHKLVELIEKAYKESKRKKKK